MSSSSHTVTSGWYTNAYSGPFRSTRLRAPSLLPGSARRPVIIPVQQTLVVDVAHNHTHTTTGNSEDNNKNVKRRETIFGPDVGEDDEPGWTESKNQEIGVEKVKEWVERSKNEQGLHATTTLQALVNLKRPTLLLQQIESHSSIEETITPNRSSIEKTDEEDITTISTHPVTSSPQRNSTTIHKKRDSTQIIQTTPLHTLNFKYDATTPMVRIQLEIYPTPKDPLSRLSLSEEEESEGAKEVVEDHEPKIIYSGLHPGGFDQGFTLPYSSALDLSDAIIPIEEQQAQEQAQQDAAAAASAGAGANLNESPNAENASVPEPVVTPPEEGGSRWRRGLFRRNREEDIENAAAIEMTNRANAAAAANNATTGQAGEGEGAGEIPKKKEIEKGMRLLIRIDGLGPEGQALPRKNAQLTHILISGTWVSDHNASTTDTTQLQPQPWAGKRVWVVKVARREAVIGSHTFLLKEIYGLSSTSTSTSNNTQYPPTADDPYASTPNECIVCLTSPRDVVLLPCRHLVVCRDCAVGMVEYGAGGKVGRREDGENTTAETTAGGASGAAAGTSGGTANPTPQVAGGTTTAGRERRKKKVKGWYCPVCRQPYTSLLRLALPESSKPSTGEGEESNELSRVPSRALSVRTTRTTRSILAPSIAPTLPDGAERMLDELRPDDVKARDSDNIEDDQDDFIYESNQQEERPQFVINNDNDNDDNKKIELEHKENIYNSKQEQGDEQISIGNSNAFDLGQPLNDVRKSQEGKGWKEV
ncbi:uncharacterized protein I206_104615 [Kwoniella pini CBS 10737]|uniref:RING-type domain-containing protein n=1 Tax=Kwoniella pini CBS 10737 TaxID=1296096 RepID=A0A1B9I7B4_9TREE|nr:uncharacterized protein I206_02149 [Kwoniella pini CBS 10737]OCF51435.1 hypothetical protein I206_02149 [Kwoniella pini CBS 10737]